jgi:hypothetical protein
VTWTNKYFNDDEINIATKEGYRFIVATIGMRVLWNKSDIVLDMPTPVSYPSHPSSSPPGDPGDDDDGGDDDGNDNAGGSGTSPPDNNNPQGGTGAASGDVTPPPTSGSN